MPTIAEWNLMRHVFSDYGNNRERALQECPWVDPAEVTTADLSTVSLADLQKAFVSSFGVDIPECDSFASFMDALATRFYVIEKKPKITAVEQPSANQGPVVKKVVIVGLMPEHQDKLSRLRPDLKLVFMGVDNKFNRDAVTGAYKVLLLPWVSHSNSCSIIQLVGKDKVVKMQRGLSSLLNYVSVMQ